MDLKQVFEQVYSIADEQGLIEDDRSFDSALSDMLQNFECETSVDLFSMFDEGEYWHSLMILQYALPQRYYSYFLDYIEDGEAIENFVRSIETITLGNWVVSEVSIDQVDGKWKLKIDDNFPGTVLDLPEEGYAVAEEATQAIVSYINSLQLPGKIEQRFSSYVEAFYLPVQFIDRLKAEDLLDLQADPASAFL